jgi:hypothetical protein
MLSIVGLQSTLQVTAMPKKSKGHKDDGKDAVAANGELWIATGHSWKGPVWGGAWENRPHLLPSGGKFLELADILLGLKKPALSRRQSRG